MKKTDIEDGKLVTDIKDGKYVVDASGAVTKFVIAIGWHFVLLPLALSWCLLALGIIEGINPWLAWWACTVILCCIRSTVNFKV